MKIEKLKITGPDGHTFLLKDTLVGIVLFQVFGLDSMNDAVATVSPFVKLCISCASKIIINTPHLLEVHALKLPLVFIRL